MSGLLRASETTTDRSLALPVGRHPVHASSQLPGTPASGKRVSQLHTVFSATAHRGTFCLWLALWIIRARSTCCTAVVHEDLHCSIVFPLSSVRARTRLLVGSEHLPAEMFFLSYDLMDAPLMLQW